MKLKKIVIKNFRQFYGNVEIEFATDHKRNVTIIHGANGSGKTALLNAFCWCLYGTINLPHKQKLITDRLIEESTNKKVLKVSVKLEFDYDEERYELSRSQLFEKKGHLDAHSLSDQELELLCTNKAGQTSKVNNPQDKVRQILPEDIHPYFFFNGEDITSLADAQDRIQDGIKNLMSIIKFERAINHLDICSKRFRKEISNFSSDEAKKYEKEIEALEDALANVDENEKEIKKQILAWESEKKMLSDRLQKLEPAKKLEENRRKIESRQQVIDSELSRLRRVQVDTVREKGMLPFLKETFVKVGAEIEGRREKGVLPAGIKDKFVQDLLDREECICGAKLVKGTESQQRVAEYLYEKAGSTEVEDKIQRLSGSISDVQNQMHEYAVAIDTSVEALVKLQDEKVLNNQHLSEISSLLHKKDDVKDIADIESKRQEIERTIAKLNKDLGEISYKRECWKEGLSDKKKALNKACSQENQARKAKRRFDVSEQARDAVKTIYGILVDKVRKEVGNGINSVLRKVTGNDFYVDLNEDFQMKTMQCVGDHTREIAKSTGQNQIASLAFIGALVDILKKNYQTKGSGTESELLRGGEYPVVMDSPFGSLDDVYGPRIAALAAQLAPQVVVMVSGKQWLGGIGEAFHSSIGKEYALVKYKPEPTEDDIEDGVISRAGCSIETVRKSDKYEYTDIEEINRA